MAIEHVGAAGGLAQLVDNLEALKAQIAPDASPAELRVFALVAARLELDPFAGQICLVGRYDKAAGRKVHRHQITVDGRLVIASRTGRLEGIDGPYWSGPRDDDGELVWRDVWTDDTEPPYVARALVHVAGWNAPANGTAKWSEFAQTDNRGQLIPTWAAMPSHMLGKVALAMALRRGFPEVAGAVVLAESTTLEPDDAAIVAEAAPIVTAPAAQVNGPARGHARARSTDHEPPSAGQVRLIRDQLAGLEFELAEAAIAVGLDFPSGAELVVDDLEPDEVRLLIDHLKAEARRRAAAS